MATVRQSDLKLWQRCPLQWRYENLDALPAEQSGSSVFGSVMHDVVLYLETEGDLEGALARFKRLWENPELLPAPPGAEPYRVDYYVRGTSWSKFAAEGPRILRDWADIIAWDTDLVLAREYPFDVPIGDGHTLHGTVDKLAIRYRARINSYVVQIVDYKTARKVPTYGYLAEDLQFSAYAFATTRPEFWAGLPNGEQLYERYRPLPRYGEWVQLTGPKRMDAGERTQRQYNRLTMAVNAFAESVAMRIFVPNISGDSCAYCQFRKRCGLEEI